MFLEGFPPNNVIRHKYHAFFLCSIMFTADEEKRTNKNLSDFPFFVCEIIKKFEFNMSLFGLGLTKN